MDQLLITVEKRLDTGLTAKISVSGQVRILRVQSYEGISLTANNFVP